VESLSDNIDAGLKALRDTVQQYISTNGSTPVDDRSSESQDEVVRYFDDYRSEDGTPLGDEEKVDLEKLAKSFHDDKKAAKVIEEFKEQYDEDPAIFWSKFSPTSRNRNVIAQIINTLGHLVSSSDLARRLLTQRLYLEVEARKKTTDSFTATISARTVIDRSRPQRSIGN
jgi:hypothetical protein